MQLCLWATRNQTRSVKKPYTCIIKFEYQVHIRKLEGIKNTFRHLKYLSNRYILNVFNSDQSVSPGQSVRDLEVYGIWNTATLDF